MDQKGPIIDQKRAKNVLKYNKKKEGTGEFHCIFMICKIIIYIFVNITRCDDKFKVAYMTDIRKTQYIGGWSP